VTEQGEVTLANAGHLSPYRNGEELLVSSDLPLGISPEEKYKECTFHLEPGDQLTLLSDGVLEATDAKGELFGFERTRAISGQTAETIADAALKFGQEDDITVLTLVRSRLAVDDMAQIQATAIPG
jgi:phosphoserine phosphatase RsbU/P